MKNNKILQDYAVWQAITELERLCRHRTATQNEDWLQVESEDRQTKPLIGYALKVLEAANVEIKRRDKFPNILIVYDRNKNEFFGRN
jgi:hypothetical protein